MDSCDHRENMGDNRELRLAELCRSGLGLGLGGKRVGGWGGEGMGGWRKAGMVYCLDGEIVNPTCMHHTSCANKSPKYCNVVHLGSSGPESIGANPYTRVIPTILNAHQHYLCSASSSAGSLHSIGVLRCGRGSTRLGSPITR